MKKIPCKMRIFPSHCLNKDLAELLIYKQRGKGEAGEERRKETVTHGEAGRRKGGCATVRDHQCSNPYLVKP